MNASKSLRIVAVGDLSLNGRYARLMKRYGPDFPFSETAESWNRADLRLGNLESPITSAPRFAPSKLALRAAPDTPYALKTAGFDCLSLANNHAMDYGARGLAETQSRLAEAGLPSAGAGTDADAARKPVVLQRNGQSVGILCFCAVEQRSPLYATAASPGVAAFRIAECVEAVRALRAQVDWLIVQIHWGKEFAQLPTPEQRQDARRLVEAGADAIFGHHPHVLQPMEMIGSAPVFYSLGNFLFSDMFWRGGDGQGTHFVSRYRLHPLSRRTGWAEVTLRQDALPDVRFQPARLNRALTIEPDNSPRREREWRVLLERLADSDYATEYSKETARAAERLAWQDAWRPWSRRLELLMFRAGLLPQAVEGT